MVITNIITFFASGGMFLRSYHVEKLMRMVPPGIKGFRVELFVAVFAKIVRAVVCDAAVWMSMR